MYCKRPLNLYSLRTRLGYQYRKFELKFQISNFKISLQPFAHTPSGPCSLGSMLCLLLGDTLGQSRQTLKGFRHTAHNTKPLQSGRQGAISQMIHIFNHITKFDELRTTNSYSHIHINHDNEYKFVNFGLKYEVIVFSRVLPTGHHTLRHPTHTGL